MPKLHDVKSRAARSESVPHICKPKSARQARHECGIFMPAGIRDIAQQHARGIKPAADLLPGVYEDLRRLARARLARLKPGQTLQTTELVHEAFLRIAGKLGPGWADTRHFFFAAARAMHDIL